MDNNGCRNNSKGFCEKFTYPIFINKGRAMTTQDVHEKSLLYSFTLLVRSIEVDISSGDRVDITGGLTLKQLRELFQ